MHIRRKPLMALALPALLAILHLAPAGAFAQNLVVLSTTNSILVYGTNGVLLQTITGINLVNPTGVAGVATDLGGNIYVANGIGRGTGTVSKYGPDFRLINPAFVSTTNIEPNLVAVDGDRNIYVSDFGGLNAVYKFDPTGHPITNILRNSFLTIVTNGVTNMIFIQGSPVWGFAQGDEMACGPYGNLYAIRGGAYGQIVEYGMGFQNVGFNPFGSVASYCVATDRAGNIYALEPGYGLPGMVYKCDPNGTLVSSFPVSPDATYNIAVDDKGYVYVGLQAGPRGGGVDEYDVNGNFVRNIPVSAFSNQGVVFAIQPAQPQLNFATTGNQALAYWTPPLTNYVLQSVTNPASTNWLAVANGLPAAGIIVGNSSPKRFFRIPSAPAPNIFVSDPDSEAIFVYDTNGALVGMLAEDAPEGMVVDNLGNLYIADLDGTVSKYGPGLNLINGALISGLPFLPFGLAVDGAGDIYIAPQGGYVSRYNSSGNLMTNNCGYTSGPLACQPNGNVYMASNSTIYVYNPFGQVVNAETSVGGVDVLGLGIDGVGHVYAIDSNNDTYKYDADLSPITNYHVNDGNSATSINGISNMAFDSSNNLYVARYDGGYDEYDANGNLLNTIGGFDAGAFIAVQPPPLHLNIATAGNQSVVFWTPATTNYVVQSVTNLASTNWLTATDAVPCIGIVISNSPPGSIFRLVPVE